MSGEGLVLRRHNVDGRFRKSHHGFPAPTAASRHPYQSVGKEFSGVCDSFSGFTQRQRTNLSRKPIDRTDLALCNSDACRIAHERLGRRRDVGPLYAALDTAMLSSAFGERFPNVLAEAMACGVPCVATDVGDGASIVGDTGLVVPPCDAEALAAGWERLRREGSEGRAARGAAARQRVTDRYALAAMIEAYGALYRELVMSDRSHAGD